MSAAISSATRSRQPLGFLASNAAISDGRMRMEPETFASGSDGRPRGRFSGTGHSPSDVIVSSRPVNAISELVRPGNLFDRDDTSPCRSVVVFKHSVSQHPTGAVDKLGRKASAPSKARAMARAFSSDIHPADQLAVAERGKLLAIGKIAFSAVLLFASLSAVRRHDRKSAVGIRNNLKTFEVVGVGAGHRLSPWAAPSAACDTYLACHGKPCNSYFRNTKNNYRSHRLADYLKMMGEG